MLFCYYLRHGCTYDTLDIDTAILGDCVNYATLFCVILLCQVKMAIVS